MKTSLATDFGRLSWLFCIHFLSFQSKFGIRLRTSTRPTEQTTVLQMKSTIPDTGVPIARPASNGGDRQEASLHGEILLRLRDYVVEGSIPDGARVPERQLCEMFGISRTPLREALKVLAAEGLIELLPNRGARVRQLSQRDLEELFDVMAGLESLAGRLACEPITDDEIVAIKQLAKAAGPDKKFLTYGDVTVTPGSTVTWTNLDGEPHTVASIDGLFRSPALDQNDSFHFTFDKPGVYKYICSIHPKMKAAVIVK